MLSDEQNSLLEKIAKEKGFKNFSVSVKDGSKKGDNYLGVIFLITIKENDGSREELLVLKCAIKNEQVRNQMPIHKCYEREVYLYDTVLPAFKKLQGKLCLPHPFKAYAKMYGYSLTEGDEWLLLEDITSRGFKMLNRRTTMDKQHILTVLKEHGKLHSLSFVMKHLEPEQYKELEENLYDIFKDYSNIQKSWIDGLKNKFEKVCKSIEDEKVIKGLKICEKDMEDALGEIENTKYGQVIIHGDFWCNNMMFKYEGKNSPTKPTELCFLDWQISKITTPMFDLCYFMFLSASKDDLGDHKKYLQEYYRILEENLKAVGCDVTKVFPFKIFEDHWKTFCKIGLYIALGMLDTLMVEEENARTFTDMAESNNDLFEVFMNPSNTQNAESSANRIRDIVLMLLDNNYL